MPDLSIELENGHVRKVEESAKLRWAPFSAKQPSCPRGHLHIDRVLRRRMVDVIALNSFADSSPSTKEGLNAYVNNLLAQFEEAQPIFHSLIPSSFKPGNENRENDWFIQTFLVIWEAACQRGKLSLGFGRFPLRASKMPRENIELHARVAINPIDFNAKVLRSTCGISVVWTYILSAHLDYDERSKSLFLFMFPSFCLANIPKTGVNDHVNIVQRCWTENPSPSIVASQEMANFMKEVLLTTHLIFSQFKKARKLFRVANASTDPLLAVLCCHEWPATFQDWNHRPRRVYDLHDDFPIFEKRLRTLNNQIALSRPKGLKELWKDDRDKLQWYTFWAVVIIGGSGLVLSICQTGLAAVQVWAIFQVNA
ncbi:hypothetical protein V499_06058 [Pseudogymnoascus sp. VKM F-103]|nr:hypothetical protein V499_06058 [Pseudogymnoascus sp. VKM F-103]